MIGTAKALYAFFRSFGIPAYNENTVPDEAELPYIVYQLSEPEWNDSATLYVRVYYRNQTSNLEALAKADEIVLAVGPAGIKLPCDGGYIWLNTTSPLVQALPQEGDIHGALINLRINSYHMPGV